MRAPLTPQLFAILNSLIEERTGLCASLADRDLLGYKLEARATEAGFTSLLDYYYLLRYDDPLGKELDALIDVLVVNETFLFRELGPLEVLCDEMAALVASGRRPRVWSAACSTGEEAMTIAILLAARGVLDSVELIASDISTRALARARTGQLGRRSLRRPLPDFAKPWLSGDDGRTVLAPSLSAAIDWRRINLLDAAALATLGPMDAIVCRNVLIYFSPARVVQVVNNLTRSLAPGAPLLVGVAESLLHYGTALQCEERQGAFFYRKATS